MHYISVLKLVAALTVVVGDQQARACQCTDAEIILSMHAADRIFTGQPIEAEVGGSSPRTITFTVEVLERLRGNTGDRTSLQTAMPGDCGARVELGAYNLYVVAAGDDGVNSCTAPSMWRDDSRHIVAAIALVTYVRDGSQIGFLNSRNWSNCTEEEFDKALALAQQMNPSGPPVIRDERGARYGDVRFVVSDGMVQYMEKE